MFVLIGAAVVVGSKVRSKVLDVLFGKPEEFEFTGSTKPCPCPTRGWCACGSKAKQ